MADAIKFTYFLYDEEIYSKKGHNKKVLNRISVEFLSEQYTAMKKIALENTSDVSFRLAFDNFYGSTVWILVIESGCSYRPTGYVFNSSDLLKEFMLAVLPSKVTYDECDRVHATIERFLRENFAHIPMVIPTLDFMKSFEKPQSTSKLSVEDVMALCKADRTRRQAASASYLWKEASSSSTSEETPLFAPNPDFEAERDRRYNAIASAPRVPLSPVARAEEIPMLAPNPDTFKIDSL